MHLLDMFRIQFRRVLHQLVLGVLSVYAFQLQVETVVLSESDASLRLVLNAFIQSALHMVVLATLIRHHVTGLIIANQHVNRVV